MIKLIKMIILAEFVHVMIMVHSGHALSRRSLALTAWPSTCACSASGARLVHYDEQLIQRTGKTLFELQ